jgi:hypothetical protein
MKRIRIALLTGVTVAALAVPIVVALTQEYPMGGGWPSRVSRASGDTATINPDRALLRWWDPIVALPTTIDNWQLPPAFGSPAAAWLPPPDGQQALNFVDDEPLPTRAPYYWTPAVPSAVNGEPWEAANPADLATFNWQFAGVQAGQEYAVFVNIPVGPTDVNPADGIVESWFQPQFLVYEIQGVDGLAQPFREVVDTYAAGGGWVRLGNGGLATDRTFRVSTGVTRLTVRLYNTVPRDAQGNLTDTRPNLLVYADAAQIVRAGGGALGSYAAQPIVGVLTQTPGAFPDRVFAARNEPLSMQVRSEIHSFSLASVTSFRHSGYSIDPADDGTGRRNAIWSWPVPRPKDASGAELDRYAQGRRNWVLGPDPATNPIATEPNVNRRAYQRLSYDDLSPYVSAGAGWTPNNVAPGFRGTGYLEAPIGGLTTVTYRPNLPDGSYQIHAWAAGGAEWAEGTIIEVYAGAGLIASVPVNQSAGPGWRPVRTAVRTTFPHSVSLPLQVRITSRSNEAADAGRKAFADVVRFTRYADLSVTAAPAFANVDVRVTPGGAPQPRDVVLVAMENGRLYCLDAAGDPLDGETTLYWTYPSDLRIGVPDPNHVPEFDGAHGIATVPTGFGTSAPLIVNLDLGTGQKEGVAFVGSRNGRVYAIRMRGRGDGTAERLWTWPDDFRGAPVPSILGPILGSVAFAETAQGPTLFVPTVQGRLYALDAVGSGGTTTVRWAYPGVAQPPIAPISMTPVVEFDRVYFGTGAGAASGNRTFYALSTVDAGGDNVGDVVWSATSAGGAAFEAFGAASPVTVPGSALTVGAEVMPDTVFVANGGNVFALAAETGALLWTTDGRPDDGDYPAVGPLAFTQMRLTNNLGVLRPNPEPVVVLTSAGGRYQALYARTAVLNRDGGRAGWEADARASSVTPPAFGGRVGISAPPGEDFRRDEENSWMFVADSNGYLYGLSFDPDFPPGGQTITPGMPPELRVSEPVNDPTNEALRQIADRAQVRLVLPEAYEKITRGLRNGTLNLAEVISLVGDPAHVTRTAFEYGEVLYYVVYDLPDPANYDPPVTYSLDFQFTSPGAATQRRTVALQRLPAGPTVDGREMIAISAFPVMASGAAALTPGTSTVQVRVQATRPGGQQSNVAIRAANFAPGNVYTVANPLALSTVSNPAFGGANQIGVTTDPANAEVLRNGNAIGPIGGPVTDKNLPQAFGPEPDSLGEPVAHGQTAVSAVWAWDRSLMRLLLGDQRGLQNVRVAVNPLAWLGGDDTFATVYKPLGAPFLYFEQPPGSPGNNTSPDYPDIRREAIRIARELFGTTQNPLFQPISLLPPAFTSAELGAYRSDPAAYNAGLRRQLIGTELRLNLDVPRFQPPNANGYAGLQFVYVDTGQPGRQGPGQGPLEAFRYFTLGADVAVDERLSVGTPVVDLGSAPGGAGFAPGAPWALAWSWDNPILRHPLFHHDRFFPFFGRFSVFNEGNVNMLNLRVAKRIEDGGAVRDVGMTHSASPLTWLDASLHLHTDLDPRFIPGGLAGRAILQKSRVDDGAPNRLRVNPSRRANAVLGVQGGPLLPDTAFPNPDLALDARSDPKIGVSVPVGAPVGVYNTRVYVFEDREASGNAPVLGPDPSPIGNPGGSPDVFEPFTDPAITLRFAVRESRLTNRQTNKAATMIDAPPSDPNFLWSNQQPTAMRLGSGSLVVAFASNRLEDAGGGGAPGWTPRQRTGADVGAQDEWRIYLATLPGGGPGGTGTAPVRDLNEFAPDATNGRWFRRSAGPFPDTSDAELRRMFGLRGGETVVPRSARFGQPAFPTSGAFDPLVPVTVTGRPALNNTFLAFTGAIDKRTEQGTVVRESRLFMATVSFGADGTPALGDPVPLTVPGDVRSPVDGQALFGRPSVVRTGDDATVFFAANAGGLTQVFWATWDGTGWQRTASGNFVESLGASNAFESVQAPSATLRRHRATGDPRIELTFVGKLRGRANAEVFFSYLEATRRGEPRPVGGGRAGDRQFARPWDTRTDPLVADPATGLFWTLGADWRLGSDDLAGPNAIDIQIRTGGTARSILDRATLRVDAARRLITAQTIYGGNAYIDAGNGSVRLDGALIPRTALLYMRYTPRFVRVSAGQGANYRGTSILFDDRFVDSGSYWRNAANNPVGLSEPVRADRFLLAYGRTAADGATATRPFLRPFRFGIQLPASVFVNPNTGQPAITVSGLPATAYYQVDPAVGRVYFTAEAEDRAVQVIFTGVDDAGRTIGNLTHNDRVGIIAEGMEHAAPIEQAGNEHSVFLALDPQNSPFNNQPAGARRAGLIWMFWTSTRAGVPDVYFQTLAPVWSPLGP